jgi:hypothetical protein
MLEAYAYCTEYYAKNGTFEGISDFRRIKQNAYYYNLLTSVLDELNSKISHGNTKYKINSSSVEFFPDSILFKFGNNEPDFKLATQIYDYIETEGTRTSVPASYKDSENYGKPGCISILMYNADFYPRFYSWLNGNRSKSSDSVTIYHFLPENLPSLISHEYSHYIDDVAGTLQKQGIKANSKRNEAIYKEACRHKDAFINNYEQTMSLMSYFNNTSEVTARLVQFLNDVIVGLFDNSAVYIALVNDPREFVKLLMSGFRTENLTDAIRHKIIRRAEYMRIELLAMLPAVKSGQAKFFDEITKNSSKPTAKMECFDFVYDKGLSDAASKFPIDIFSSVSVDMEMSPFDHDRIIHARYRRKLI